ncbi:hypothetical protein [Rhizobium sp. ZK1]|uniref:hypothetical protein n=1 Tax=Rhizobium TaxID=379 RepID=UPI0039F6E296
MIKIAGGLSISQSTRTVNRANKSFLGRIVKLAAKPEPHLNVADLATARQARKEPRSPLRE